MYDAVGYVLGVATFTLFTRLFNMSIKMLPMKLFNAPLVMPADGGLMKVLPFAMLIW